MKTVETPDQESLENWENWLIGTMCTPSHPRRWSGEWCEWTDMGKRRGSVHCEICDAILPDNTYSLTLHGRWHISQLPADEAAAFQTLWLLCEGNHMLVCEQWGVR